MDFPNIAWNGKVVMEESEAETFLMPLVVLVLNRKIPR